MKKTFTLVLALVLVMSLCAVAFAAKLTDDNFDASGVATDSSDVTLAGSTVDTVYNVVVEFGTLQYNLAMTWNPEDIDTTADINEAHTYTATLTPVTDTNTIKVTNHSNIDITADYAYVQKNTVAGVTIAMDAIATQSLDSAAEVAYANYDGAANATVNPTFTIALASGYVSGKDILNADATTFGTITVTIEDATLGD